jgi:uncharacterized SAM-binding protein YcdF (DUF218 family)
VTLSLLMLAVLAAVLLGACRWRRLAIAVGSFALVVFLGVGCGPLAACLADAWQPAGLALPPWQGRNVIVLLGAGTARLPDGGIIPTFQANGRIVRAVALYHGCAASGMACVLVISGGDAQHHGASEASVYAAVARALGVPAASIVLEDRSMNTWQNAQFSAGIIRAQRPDAVWLVSSATHLRRAALYFDHAGIAATMVPADDLRATHEWWPQAWNFYVADVVLHEYVGVWQYRCYEAMGWNAPRVQAPGIPPANPR